MNHALRLADRWFRWVGIATIVALAATIVMLLLGAEGWRWPFVAAHLGGLLALLPVAVVVVVHAYREEGSLSAMIARHPVVTAAIAVLVVTITASLMEFSGDRNVRRVANFTSVGVILGLVSYYLCWAPRHIPRA